MIVCILSDSHDRVDRMLSAARNALAEGAEAFLHCGDLIESGTLTELKSLGKPIYLVHGNNSGNLEELRVMATRTNSGIRYYGAEADFVLAGRRIFLSHFPHRAIQMAQTGRYDLLCCGHSHASDISAVEHSQGAAVVLNPGTVGGIGAPPTYAVGSLETLSFEIRELDSANS